ncbi:MAG: response regulator [Luteibaculaceae bacterium]
MNTKKKILIVDDEPNIILSLDFLMRKNKYQVFIARNGKEALEIARQQLPDVMLLDIMMPEVDGFEVCETLKNDEKTKHIKIIFLSAKSAEVDIEQGLKLGASDYVTKPFSTKALVEKVNQLVNN